MYDFDALNQWNSFSQTAMDRFVRLNRISTAAIERLARQQIVLVEQNVKAGIENAQGLRDMHDVTELMRMQPQMAMEYAETLRTQAQELLDIVLEAQAEITSLAEESLQSLGAAPTSVAKKAPARRKAG